MEKKNCL